MLNLDLIYLQKPLCLRIMHLTNEQTKQKWTHDTGNKELATRVGKGRGQMK